MKPVLFSYLGLVHYLRHRPRELSFSYAILIWVSVLFGGQIVKRRRTNNNPIYLFISFDLSISEYIVLKLHTI